MKTNLLFFFPFHFVAEIEELESEWTLQRPEKVDQQGEKFDNDTLTHSPTNQMANHVDSEKPQLIDVEKLKGLILNSFSLKFAKKFFLLEILYFHVNCGSPHYSPFNKTSVGTKIHFKFLQFLINHCI